MSAERSLLDVHVVDAQDEGELAAASVVPDFADVIARAARLRPRAPDELERELAIARELDALDDAALARAARIGGLGELVESARATADAQAEASEPPPLVLPVKRGRARWVALAAATAAIAAAVVLAWGLRAQLVSPGAGAPLSGASQSAAMRTAWSEATLERARAPRARPSVRARPEPTPAVLPSEPAPLERIATPPRKSSRVAERDRLAELDASARAAWKRGELARAQAELEQLVRKGGRSALADIAWGDLFELARQRGDRDGELRLLRRYLKVFPRGRYAEDARAGTCRRSRGDAAASCWRDYLAAHPQGTWREQAKSAIAAVDRVTPAK